MKVLCRLAASILILGGISTPIMGQDSVDQAPTHVFTLSEVSSSWNAVRLTWQVPWMRGLVGSMGDTVVLESNKQGEVDWIELGRFPFRDGEHTNQIPLPLPPPILLPEMIMAPDPSFIDVYPDYSGSYGSVTITNPGGWTIGGGSLGITYSPAYYTNHRLEADTLYNYRIKVVNSYGAAPYSEVLTVQTKPLPPPDPPDGLMVLNLMGASLELHWTRSLWATEHVVERKFGDSDWQQVGLVGGDQHYWTDNLVSAGQTYQYRVRGRNGSGISSPGPETYATAHQLTTVFHEPVESQLSANWETSLGVALRPDSSQTDKNTILFRDSSPCSLTTRPMAIRKGGFIELEIKDHQSGNRNTPILVYGRLEGKEWTTIAEIDHESSIEDWRKILIQLPPSWSGRGIQFSFVQNESYYNSGDSWSIGGVRVLAIIDTQNDRPKIFVNQPMSRKFIQSDREITISGEAIDNQSLRNWAWSLNGGPWKTRRLGPGNQESWMGMVRRLKPGINTIRVRACNSAGIFSPKRSIKVVVR